jgi:hypothetical protein
MSAEAIQQQLVEQQQIILQLQNQLQALQQQQTFQHEITKQTVEAAVSSMAKKVRQIVPANQTTAKMAKPSTFNGSVRSNIELWLFEMKSYLDACQVPEEQRVQFVGSYLKENAALWFKYEMDYAAAMGVQVTWEVLERKLLQRFKPIESNKTARVAIASLRQLGSVQHYCNLFQQYVTLANDMSEVDKIFAFQRGLKPHVAKEVDLKEPQTLTEAMNYAIRAEARNNLLFKTRSFQSRFNQSINQWGNNYGTPMEVDNVNVEESTETESHPVNTIDVVRRSNRVEIRQSDKERCLKERRCFNCKLVGHNHRQCVNPYSKNFPA